MKNRLMPIAIMCVLCLACLAVIAGCKSKTPRTTVKAVDNHPGVIVAHAPEGAVLFVDGKSVGEARHYNGKKHYLQLKPGSHTVLIIDSAGRPIVRDTIFVDSEIKTIEVPSSEGPQH